jgi:hypothetical protein
MTDPISFLAPVLAFPPTREDKSNEIGVLSFSNHELRTAKLALLGACLRN